MKPVPRTLLQSALVVVLAVGLSLAFNANRQDSLPLIKPAQNATQAAAGEIALTEAMALHQNGTAVFLDARDSLTYAEGHIQGALSLPLETFEYDFPRYEAQLANQTIVTYCDGEQCRLSHDLSALLKAKGLTDVRVLGNGWSLWLNATLPTASGPNPE